MTAKKPAKTKTELAEADVTAETPSKKAKPAGQAVTSQPATKKAKEATTTAKAPKAAKSEDADSETKAEPKKRGRKPKAETEADVLYCLKLLSGRNHKVLTGVALIAPDGRLSSRLVETKVGFKRLSDAERDAYVASGEWKGKAFMCTRDREFRIEGRENCLVRGFDRTGFFEIDTGKDARSWTVQLTDSNQPGQR